MRILIGTNHLDSLGGTEIWTLTMYRALRRLGHEVDVFACNGIGVMYRNMTPFDGQKLYDLALINHHTTLERLSRYSTIKKRIYTCHGVIPPLERPIKGADVYVGVSEETAELCKALGFSAEIIRNPIDTTIFHETRPINKTLKTVLLLSTHGGEAREQIREACRGLELLEIGMGKKSMNPEEWINKADLVIGLGRSAYEALACRRNVIVYDYNGGDGFINSETIHVFNQRNCSGRTGRAMFTSGMIRDMFDKYDPELDLTNYINEQHEAQSVALKYLELASKVV